MKNQQIALVEQWFQSIGKPLDNAQGALSDMEIIQFQALLMDNGANLLRAFKQGDMAVVLAGLVNLAYSSVTAAVLAGAREDMPSASANWRHDGLIISIMRSLSHLSMPALLERLKIMRRSMNCANAWSETFSTPISKKLFSRFIRLIWKIVMFQSPNRSTCLI